jgi:FtsP/CotA-like multicopper oxidase with cupredoxin domain
MRKRWLLLCLVFSGCDDDSGSVVDLDPMTIPKFSQPLLIPPAMSPTAVANGRDEYRIGVRQFAQQVLPPPMPQTTVWGYGSVDNDASFSYPAATIEARSGRPVRVEWINELVQNGRFLRHLLPVDQTIHWADPGNEQHEGHDNRDLARPYIGPVPIVTHVHGAHSFDHSDGHPEAWFLPNANNIPATFSLRGPTFQTQADVGTGAAVFDYPMDESAATLWYHDHALGMTRSNVYAGLAGFWIIRDNVDDGMNLPGPAPRVGDAPGTPYYEIPLVIQDKNFTEDGELSYPASRHDYDQYTGPVFPDSDVPPIWGPEFIGDTILVNGRAWPFLEVEPRLYRFRILNAADARTFMLELDRVDIPFVKIGVDGGFMSGQPVQQSQLLMGPAERVDVLVDFSALSPGDTVLMRNVGPDDPWGGPNADPPQDPANPDTTGQIMQFRVVARTTNGVAGAIPTALPTMTPLTPTVPPRDLLLQELETPDGMFPVHVRLGTVALGPLAWADPATEIIKLDSTEVWRVANTTDDAHPIHLHLIDFQILDRTPFDVDAFKAAGPNRRLEDFITGPAVPANPSELGPKDTVMMLPGTITRIVARFDRAGNYVWHCHIIEHEDNDMMRPMVIEP